MSHDAAPLAGDLQPLRPGIESLGPFRYSIRIYWKEIPGSRREAAMMTTMTPNITRRERGAGSDPDLLDVSRLDFSRLDDQRFEVRSGRDFDSVTELMNDRFGGLPSFHRSVRLDLTDDQKWITGETGDLTIPPQLDRMVEPHLRADLEQLISHINRGEGIKTLGILRLNIGLHHDFAREHLEQEGSGTHPLIRAAARLVGTRIRVPIVLAVASRKSGDHYESLAVGIRGVTRYCSALVVRPHRDSGRFEVTGGLEAEVKREDIDHPISRILVACGDRVLPRDFFNNYLQRYMVPERRTIVTRLCHYVFSGLQGTGADDSSCTVIPHHASWRMAS